jgi:hypothetical protein
LLVSKQVNTFTKPKAIKPAEKRKKMTIEQLIKKVQEISPAINCFPAGTYMIEGNYRGKKSEKFKFNCKTLEFEYNTAAPAVASAFEQAISNLNN